MLRFLHAGDFHLDSPFSSLSPRQAAVAREEQRELLARLRRLALDRTVDLVFLTGDLFDSGKCFPETIELLQETLAAIPAEIFISPGNHDPYTPDSPYARLPWAANVHIFSTPGLQSFPLPHLGCTVYGTAFVETSRQDSPLATPPPPGDDLRFGCFHGDMGTRTSRYGPIHPQELARSGLDYIALGHIHTRTELYHAGKSSFAYCGCPQGRGFDETGEKGAYYGSMDDKGQVTLDFVPLALRRYLSLSVELDGQTASTALAAALPMEAIGDIARIFLQGRRAQAENLDMAALYQLSSERFYSVALIDESLAPRDLWDRENETGLCGLFLQELRRRMEDAPPEEQERYHLALRYGLAALEGREEPQ